MNRSGPGLFVALPALLAGLLVALLAPLALLWTRGRWLRLVGRWLYTTPQPGSAEAIVALGGSDTRLLHAITLFKQNPGVELWFTGDGPHAAIRNTTYGERALHIAVANGVPIDQVRLLASASTWEDIRAIAAEAQRSKIQSLLIVTDWWHSRRALGLARMLLSNRGITVFYEPVANQTFGPENWWRSEYGLTAVVNEFLRLLYYWRHYDLRPWRL